MSGGDSGSNINGGGDFSNILVKSYKDFATVREMKYTSQSTVTKQWTTEWPYIANNETIETWRTTYLELVLMLFSELYKIMVNKVTFVVLGGWSPQSPPWIRPWYVYGTCYLITARQSDRSPAEVYWCRCVECRDLCFSIFVQHGFRHDPLFPIPEEIEGSFSDVFESEEMSHHKNTDLQDVSG